MCLRVAPVWRRRDRIAFLIGLLPSQSYIVSNFSATKIHLHLTLSGTLQSQFIPSRNFIKIGIMVNRSIASLPCRLLPLNSGKSSWLWALIRSSCSHLYCVE